MRNIFTTYQSRVSSVETTLKKGRYLQVTKADSIPARPGERCRGRTSRSVIDYLLEIQCGQLWQLKTSGGPSHKGEPPQYCEFYLQKLNQTLTASSEKNPFWPLLLVGEEEKEPFWNMPEHSVLLNKACPQEKLINLSLTCWAIIRL